MDTETARLIGFAITAVGAAVWVIAGWYLLRVKRGLEASMPDEEVRFRPGAEKAGQIITGGRELEGEPAELAANVVALVARFSSGSSRAAKVVEQTDERVVFEQAARIPFGFRRAEFQFTPVGTGRTTVEFSVETKGLKWMLRIAGLIQVVGLIALAVGFWIVQTYVAPDPDPAVRRQVFQGLQVVHFLWPPIMLAWLHKKILRAIGGALETLVHNLPHTPD